jgi:hypothetical protein
MINALLGAVQAEAAMADAVKLNDDARHAARGVEGTAQGSRGRAG